MIPTELASPSSLPGRTHELHSRIFCSCLCGQGKAAMTLEGAENDELARGRSTKG